MNLHLPPEGRKVDRQATRVLHIPSPGDAKLLRSHDDGRQRLLVDESPVTASLVNYCEVVPDVAAFPRAVLAPAPGGYMLCVMKAIHVQHQSTLALCRDSSYPIRLPHAGEVRPGKVSVQESIARRTADASVCMSVSCRRAEGSASRRTGSSGAMSATRSIAP